MQATKLTRRATQIAKGVSATVAKAAATKEPAKGAGDWNEEEHLLNGQAALIDG